MFSRHRLGIAALSKLLAVAGEGSRPPHMAYSGILPAKYRYRRRLPHLQKADADLFITFCAASPLPLPGTARDLVLQHCLRDHQKRICLHAAVVMPDHVHLLLMPLRDRDGWPIPLVELMQCLKGATAHRINRLLHRQGPVWEEESFDHVLRSDESLKEKCEYIRQNPVKAGLVPRPEDYRWLWVNPDLAGDATEDEPGL